MKKSITYLTAAIVITIGINIFYSKYFIISRGVIKLFGATDSLYTTQTLAKNIHHVKIFGTNTPPMVYIRADSLPRLEVPKPDSLQPNLQISYVSDTLIVEFEASKPTVKKDLPCAFIYVPNISSVRLQNIKCHLHGLKTKTLRAKTGNQATLWMDYNELENLIVESTDTSFVGLYKKNQISNLQLRLGGTSVFESNDLQYSHIDKYVSGQAKIQANGRSKNQLQ